MNKNIDRFFTKILCVIMTTLGIVYNNADAAERVAVRTNNTSARRTVTTAVKRNTTTTQPKTDTTTPVATTEPAAETTPTVVEEPAPVIIENKTIQFNNVLSSNSVSSDDASVSDLAEQVRNQRAAFENQEASDTLQRQQQEALAFGKNTCDNGLRKCMSETCGSDFTKCALDGDTMFGEKLNKCRLKTTCSGEEFKLFTTEIKADRDFNVQMESYNAVIECGNNYNKCITTECGATFGKCLGKSAADRAIKKCATIAKNCTQQDSGLAARVGTVIGKLRETAEQDVKADEKRLYDLRDLMRKQCQHLGATFDERSLDCVYTVNFFAGTNQSTPTASRKLYAGDSFVCMQEWFGINATTFKENAYRETRSQTAASSALLGSGLGTAAGLISSGAIGRALETQQAKKDYKKECESQGGKLKDGDCVLPGDKDYDKIKPEDTDKDNTKAQAKAECDEKQKTDSNCRWRPSKAECDCTPSTKDTKKKEACDDVHGNWDPTDKTCTKNGVKLTWKNNTWINTKEQAQLEKDAEKQACKDLGATQATWDDITGCTCLQQDTDEYTWNSKKKQCEKKVVKNIINRVVAGFNDRREERNNKKQQEQQQQRQQKAQTREEAQNLTKGLTQYK